MYFFATRNDGVDKKTGAGQPIVFRRRQSTGITLAVSTIGRAKPTTLWKRCRTLFYGSVTSLTPRKRNRFRFVDFRFTGGNRRLISPTSVYSVFTLGARASNAYANTGGTGRPRLVQMYSPKCAQFVTGDVAIPHRNISGCLARIIPVAYPPYPLPQMPIRSLSMNFSVSFRYLKNDGRSNTHDG